MCKLGNTSLGEAFLVTTRFALISISSTFAFAVTLLAQSDRISGQVDATHLVKLAGNVKPQAKPAADEGPVDPAMKLSYVHLMLKPTAAQQTELDQLLIAQQDRRSPNFRKWLTPDQFGDRFGVSQPDIDKITGWLKSQGFDIITVGGGRRFIAFNATAQQVQSALKTEIHHYRVNGDLHFANATDPSVPAAIQPLVSGFLGLNDFEPTPMLRAKDMKPGYTGTGGGHNITPGDLAIIYDIAPLYNMGYTGAGETIAVIGRTNIYMSDISTFRSIFGLPPNLPQLVLVPGSADPGVVADFLGEADLDLEYSGGIAYDAQILFVYSPTVVTSLIHAITANVAPVITYSFGICEEGTTSVEASEYQKLGQQANAQGITWLASSGDSGAAACDAGAAAASHGAAVQLESALPEVTGVGGTMFSVNAGYWQSYNNGNGSSAISYIPETVWNETALFNSLAAGGGGYSSLYSRAAWQVGPGIPAGAARGVPDVSLTAGTDDDPYALYTNGGPDHVGGTSAGTPTFAGIIVLLNQYLGINGLGNINPNLYWMAQNTSGVFHDITTGWNGVPCVAGSPNCNSSGAFGYNAGPGWDAATGLGSVDAYQMFNQWNTGGGTPQIGGVLNGASLTDTGLSPGLIFSVFGSNLGPATPLFGEVDPSTNALYSNADYVAVFVNGTPAPLLYVGPNQINAVAPYELAGSVGQSVVVQVNDNGATSNAFNVNVVATAPAIFSLGNSQGAILNQDGSVNGPNNPAARGSIISIYATGEGQLNPSGVDGQIADESLANLPRPAANFSLTIGGKSATYTYAGTAPQSFEGFFQVDAVIPASVGSGKQPVILKIGGASSPPLNVAVQ
jgi:uncharacterized protein (TIGR03437 family)